MNYAIVVTPYAEFDLKEALEYYAEIRLSLADTFRTEINTLIERIQHKPSQFPLALGLTHKAVLKSFPYNIYFLVDNETVYITAVFNTWRNPKIWHKR